MAAPSASTAHGPSAVTGDAEFKKAIDELLLTKFDELVAAERRTRWKNSRALRAVRTGAQREGKR